MGKTSRLKVGLAESTATAQRKASTPERSLPSERSNVFIAAFRGTEMMRLPTDVLLDGSRGRNISAAGGVLLQLAAQRNSGRLRRPRLRRLTRGKNLRKPAENDPQHSSHDRNQKDCDEQVEN